MAFEIRYYNANYINKLKLNCKSEANATENDENY